MKSNDGISIGASIIVIAVIFAIACGVESCTCAAKAGAMHLDADWGPVTGCMVQVGARTVPIDSYRVVAP